MKRKPLSVIIISIFYFLEPFGNLIQAAYINQMPLFGHGSILSRLLWSDWIILALFPIVAIGIYMMKKWGWYLFLGFSALLIFYNIYVYKFLNPNYSLKIILAFILIITLTSALFLRKSVYAPYFNPRLRWWETAKRFRVPLNTFLLFKDGSMECKTLDISETGCFVELRDDLPLGAQVITEFECGNIEINCLGRIVNKRSESGEQHPGYGIKFQSVPEEAKKRLRQLTWYLEKIGLEDRRDLGSAMNIPGEVFLQEYSLLDRIGIRLKTLFRLRSVFK